MFRIDQLLSWLSLRAHTYGLPYVNYLAKACYLLCSLNTRCYVIESGAITRYPVRTAAHNRMTSVRVNVCHCGRVCVSGVSHRLAIELSLDAMAPDSLGDLSTQWCCCILFSGSSRNPRESIQLVSYKCCVP